MNHDALIRAIEETIATDKIGFDQTRRALQVTPAELRQILKTGIVPEKVVAQAAVVGIFPAAAPTAEG